MLFVVALVIGAGLGLIVAAILAPLILYRPVAALLSDVLKMARALIDGVRVAAADTTSFADRLNARRQKPSPLVSAFNSREYSAASPIQSVNSPRSIPSTTPGSHPVIAIRRNASLG